MSIITCYIGKISSPVFDDVFKRERHFDIYILRLSVSRATCSNNTNQVPCEYSLPTIKV